jgi:hypothetical protein
MKNIDLETRFNMILSTTKSNKIDITFKMIDAMYKKHDDDFIDTIRKEVLWGIFNDGTDDTLHSRFMFKFFKYMKDKTITTQQIKQHFNDDDFIDIRLSIYEVKDFINAFCKTTIIDGEEYKTLR